MPRSLSAEQGPVSAAAATAAATVPLVADASVVGQQRSLLERVTALEDAKRGLYEQLMDRNLRIQMLEGDYAALQVCVGGRRFLPSCFVC